MGTYHVVTGRLRCTDNGFYIDADEGGYWELIYPGSAPCPLGDRIIVEGYRVGFNILQVEIVRPSEPGLWPDYDRNRLWKRLFRIVKGRWPKPDDYVWRGFFW
jgi:hypothetical protein